jgi:metal-responsive CopG/Arc/MetJ family transcriptional regulator
MAYSRIAITLPKDVLVSLDRRARALHRSRSGVVADAVRAFLAGSP